MAVGGIFYLIQNKYFESAPTTSESPYPTVNAEGDPILGVFEGRTPCPDCGDAQVKTVLVLYHNGSTNKPTTYWFGRVYVRRGNDRIVTQGSWTVQRGTPEDSQAVVYTLDSNTPEEFRSYWRVNEDILLPLDQNMNLKVGNAAWGYMLSKTH